LGVINELDFKSGKITSMYKGHAYPNFKFWLFMQITHYPTREVEKKDMNIDKIKELVREVNPSSWKNFAHCNASCLQKSNIHIKQNHTQHPKSYTTKSPRRNQQLVAT